MFAGTYRGTTAAVETVKKAYVDETVLPALLERNHANIDKLLHTELGEEVGASRYTQQHSKIFGKLILTFYHIFPIRYYVTALSLGSMNQLFFQDDDPKKLKVQMPSDRMILLQLANGLNFIHSKQLAHGEIRPENVRVFISSFNSSTVDVKWTGFGLFKSASKAVQLSQQN